mmetsp:Transcript_53004/g.126499  ORF Transcript_53004/g.126499 Transcript_53004/m.126499 type:complete len:91 (+) Transcript_53004:348-620(+)
MKVYSPGTNAQVRVVVVLVVDAVLVEEVDAVVAVDGVVAPEAKLLVDGVDADDSELLVVDEECDVHVEVVLVVAVLFELPLDVLVLVEEV